MTDEARRVHRCVHLTKGSLPLHSTLTWDTAEKNETVYEWREEVYLCTFCSGKLRGWVNAVNGIEIGEDEP